MFCSYFGAAVAKIFNKYKKISPYKVFGNPESVFQPKLPGKERDNNNITSPVTSHDLSNFGQTLAFSGNSGWENKVRVFKKVFRGLFQL